MKHEQSVAGGHMDVVEEIRHPSILLTDSHSPMNRRARAEAGCGTCCKYEYSVDWYQTSISGETSAAKPRFTRRHEPLRQSQRTDTRGRNGYDGRDEIWRGISWMMTDTPVCRWDPRIPVPDFAKDRGGRGLK